MKNWRKRSLFITLIAVGAIFAGLVPALAEIEIDEGDFAPQFALRSITNKSYFLADMIEANEDIEPGPGKKISVLAFVNSKCEKCAPLLSILNEARNKYVAKGVRVFVVGVGEGNAELLPFAKKNKLRLTVCNDKFNTTSKLYAIGSTQIPKIFLITPRGEIETIFEWDADEKIDLVDFKEDLFDELEDLIDDFEEIFGTEEVWGKRRKLVYGRVPADVAVEEGQSWQPFMLHLEQTLGLKIEYKTTATYESFLEELKKGTFDLANIGPLQYIEVRGKYEPVARTSRNDDDSYTGIIIAGEGINTLADLKGKKIGFVSEDSTSGYLFPLMLLADQNLLPERDFTPVFLGSHTKVAQAVLAGKLAAGACFDDCRLSVVGEDDARLKKTKKIATTSKIPGDPVIVRRSLDSSLKDELQEAILSASTDQVLIDEIQKFDRSFTGFIMAIPADYDPIVRAVESVRQMKRQLEEDKRKAEAEAMAGAATGTTDPPTSAEGATTEEGEATGE
jgi:phosphonate transport system substrate-binding protein